MHFKLFTLLTLLLLTSCNTKKAEEADEERYAQVQGILYSDGSAVTVYIDSTGNIQKVSSLENPDIKPEYYIAPGLIDIQINGYMGVDFSDPAITSQDMEKVTKALWATGITTYIPTVITSSDENLVSIFKNLKTSLDNPSIAESIPGFHLEGPYISPVKGFRGAHLEKYIREPDWEEFNKYRELSGNRMSIVAVAPEMENSIPFIRNCVDHGITVTLAHHNGSAEDVQKAVDAGARLSNHLGNGCANMINRHNNPLWPQLSNDSLYISIIADGFHLTKDEVRTFYKVKGDEKTILVSDALDLAGLPPGEYVRGERKFLLTENVVKFPAENVLAGAASPLKKCVANVMEFTGCDLESAITMASSNPAKLLGLNTGELKSGKRADLFLFKISENDLEIYETYVAGRLVYKKSE